MNIWKISLYGYALGMFLCQRYTGHAPFNILSGMLIIYYHQKILKYISNLYIKISDMSRINLFKVNSKLYGFNNKATLLFNII